MGQRKMSMRLTVLLITTIILISGCLGNGGEENDDDKNDIPPYIHHSKNKNISLEIVEKYYTDSLSGENDEGKFTIYPNGTNEFMVVILNITNIYNTTDNIYKDEYDIDTGEEQIQMFDNQGKDRSMTYVNHGQITDPNGNESYDITDFYFTNISFYLTLSNRPIPKGFSYKVAAVGLAPHGSIRRIVLGFKIIVPSAPGTPGDIFQKVYIDV
ncbi:MAG: hypothetical protein R6U61_00465 [Thermoplasmata archaeon]